MAKSTDRVKKASDGRYTVVFDGKSRGRFKAKADAVAKLEELTGGNPGGGSHVPRPRPDRTPSRPARPGKPSLAMRIDSRAEIEFVPEDLLAMSLSMLFALRLETAKIGEEEGEFVTLLTDWFSSEEARRGGLSGIDQSRKDLTDEIQFFREMFKAMGPATAKIGFTVEEWGRAFFAITGEPEVSFGEVEILGLDAPVPPVVGDITTSFSLGHPAVDIKAVVGTPMRAPEDMVIATVDRMGAEKGLGLTVSAWSRTPELGAFPEIGKKGAITPQEGVRRHSFGHMSAISVNPGDRLERGAVFGHSGNTGTKTTGPHVHWAMKLYVVQGNLFGRLLDATGLALPGSIALTPMDPASFVPSDVIEGGGTARPPAVVWNMVNPDKPSETIGGPSYDIRLGTGDIIFNGSKSVRTKRSDVRVDPEIDVDVGLLGFPPAGGFVRPGEVRGGLVAPGGRPVERLLRRPPPTTGLLGLAHDVPVEVSSPFEAADPTPRVVSGIASREEAEMELTRGAARERVALGGVSGAATGAVAGAAGGPIGAVIGGVVGAGIGIAGGLLGLPKRPEGGRPRRRSQ